MKLIGNKILAEIIPDDKKTKSGIILSDNINLNKNRAEIVLVGPKVKHYKVGQVIQYNSNTAQYDTVRGSECVFLREDQDVILLISERKEYQKS